MTEASFRTKDQKYSYSNFQAFCEANPLPIRTSTFATERSLVPLGYPHSKDPPELSRRPCSDFRSDHAEQGTICSTNPPLGFNFTAQGHLDYPRGLLPPQILYQEHKITELKNQSRVTFKMNKKNKKQKTPVAVIDITPSVIPAHLSVDNGLCHQVETEKEVKQESNYNVSTLISPKSLKKRRDLSENRIAYLKRNKTHKRREKGWQ